MSKILSLSECIRHYHIYNNEEHLDIDNLTLFIRKLNGMGTIITDLVENDDDRYILDELRVRKVFLSEWGHYHKSFSKESESSEWVNNFRNKLNDLKNNLKDNKWK